MGIEAEWALRRLAYGYAEAVDRGDGDALARLFTPDGSIESPRGVVQGHDQLRVLPADVQARYRRTFHAVLNQLAEIDGDRATATTYCLARHLIGEAGDPRCYEMTILYHDAFARGDDGWRFTRRRLEVLWTQTLPASG